MLPNSALFEILILLFAAVVAVAAIRLLTLPATLGYLAVGMVLGPHALNLVHNNAVTHVLAEFGVLFLVFTLGLEFSLPRMIAMRWEVFGLGSAQMLLTTAAGAICAAAFGVALLPAIVLGGALAMSSTAIVVSQLAEHSEVNRTHGRLSIAMLLFQDLAFVLFLALTAYAASGGAAYSPAAITIAVGKAILALLIVLAFGRWLLRPSFLFIVKVRSAELFSLAVLLVALASAWLTSGAGLSAALGAFLAGMMLAETEFRHQIEATIRSYRDILLGLFFITIGMLFDMRLLLRQLPIVLGILVSMLLLKTALTMLVTRPAAGHWFKALRAGIVMAVAGEFGFALLTLLLDNELLAPNIVQPVFAATVLSMVLSPFLIRHNRGIARFVLRESGPPGNADFLRVTASDRALATRDHVVLCGFGRVGQNIARVLEKKGFEYIALDMDPHRIRLGKTGGDPVFYGDASQAEVLENVGLRQASCVVITFANPNVSTQILRAIRKLRGDVPVLVRTQDDTRLEDLQRAGATEVVPETFEASLMLLSHLLLLLKLPASNVFRTIGEIRSHRYGMLKQIFRAGDAELLDDTHAFREELGNVVLPPQAWAVGKTIEAIRERGAAVEVQALRRDGILGRDPEPATVLRDADVLVLYGTPEALEHAESVLLMG
jgi:monovalent cation:H+ antiporter-2, CPA2 family